MFVFFLFINCIFSCYYTNPVCPHGADPWVVQHQYNISSISYYYYSYTLNGKEFTISRTQKLEDICQPSAEIVYTFTPPSGKSYSENVWAPELHYINNQWFVYFAAGTGPIPTQRMHVLRGADKPEKGFQYYGKLNLPDDQYSIDGTVLEVNNNLYFVWSGWPDESKQIQNLYISEMDSPYSIKRYSKRVLISTPTYNWETSDGRINEGPEQLNSPSGKVFIIYSATGSMSNNYALGQLELIDPKNPLNINSWKKKSTPIFTRTDKVWGPGHCSFTKSPSGKENWIVYHSARCDGCGWDRWVNIQKFQFDKFGRDPILGQPINPNVNTTCPI